MNILFIDTETSNLDPKTGQIMQLAMLLKNEQGETVNTFNKYVKVENAQLSLEALKINKLYQNQDYKILGISEVDLVANLVKFLLELPKDTIVCGQFVQFDLGFIKATLTKYNIHDMEACLGRKSLDTSTIALFLRDAGLMKFESSSLVNLAKSLGIEVKEDTLHDALADVTLTAEVYYKMKALVSGNREPKVISE